jgi:hypothetical protein
VLLEATRTGRRIDQVVIATTYLEDNASSHFAPLADSARIYWPLVRHVVSSVLISARAPR